jgi:hypothetical protein
LNVDFYWQFLLQMPRLKIGPATELQELRALPEIGKTAEIVGKLTADSRGFTRIKNSDDRLGSGDPVIG